MPGARLSNCLLVRNGHLAHHSSESEMIAVRTGGDMVSVPLKWQVSVFRPLKNLPSHSPSRPCRVGGAQWEA